MENHLQTLVCPNCGASTTNHHNCDYCGSILVRFAAQNIAVDQTKYGKNAVTIPGLKEELKKNLLFQETNNEDRVVTFINHREKEICRIMSPNVFQEGLRILHELPESTEDDNLIVYHENPSTSENLHKGLIINFSFYHLKPNVGDGGLCSQFGWTYAGVAALKRGIVESTVEEEVFLQSSFASLAEVKRIEEKCGTLLCYDETGTPCWGEGCFVDFVNSYTIDFGNDYEGAANVITQYLNEVKGISNSDNVSFRTATNNAEFEAKEEEERQKVVEEQKTEEKYNKIWYIIIVIIGLITFFLSQLS